MNQKINREILEKLIEIISFELNNVNKLALISEKIRLSRNKTPYELFKIIDKKNEKFLNMENLMEFLNDYNKRNFNENEIGDVLFRMYKMDKDYISFDDFQEIFTPIRVLENIENDENDENNNNEKEKEKENVIINNGNDLRNSKNEKSNFFKFFM